MNQVNTLKQAFDLSDKILIAIGQEDLEEITRLDVNRRAVIDQYYLNNNSIDAELTRLLKQKNDEIVSRLFKMQQQTRTQQIKLKQSQQVSKAYLDNT